MAVQKPIVFAGPSIWGVAPEELAHVDLRAPAARGDVLRAVRDGARAIGLIDGCFEGVPAIWHKEILFALDAGIPVCGAASMGALRAAECHQFGMVGIGAIFEDYRSGRRTADADVGLLHGPAEFDFMPLSLALVDCDAMAGRLVEAGLADTGEVTRIQAGARALHFKERDWDSVLDRAAIRADRRAAIAAAIAATDFSQKREDARSLLRNLSEKSMSEITGNIGFTATLFWSQLEREVTGISG